MKQIVFIISILFSITFFACNENKPISKEEQIEKIAALEKILSEKIDQFDTLKSKESLELYLKYSNEFPKDKMASEYLFRAGKTYFALEDFEKAIEIYKDLIRRYPNNGHVPNAYFAMGFIYENHLGMLGKAKEAYTKVIVDFPEHNLVESAKISIQNLGKSPDEIFKSFKKEKADSTAMQ